MSRLMGRRLLARETQCQGCGHDLCRVIVKPVEDWDNCGDDLKYFQPRSNRAWPDATGQASQ